MPLLKGIDHSLPRDVGGKEHGVAHVGADVVAGALEAKPVSFFQGIPDESGRLVAADLSILGGRARGAEMLVIVTVALIDFHDRLDFRAVIAPVRSHIGGAGMRRTDAAE